MSRLPARSLVPALLIAAATLPTGAASASAPAGPPAARVDQADACGPRVAFALVEATGCLIAVAPGRWESTSTVTVNGLALPVAPGTRLVLSGPTPEAPGGRLEVDTAITLAGVRVHEGVVAVDLPAGDQGDERDVISLRPAAGQRMFGLGVAGGAALRFGYGADGRHYSMLRVVLSLPELFRAGPEPGASGLTATVGVRVDDRGVRADAVKAQVANAYVGQLLIRDLCLSYTAAGTTTTTPCSPPAFGAQPLLTCSTGPDVARWDGTAAAVMPTESRTELGVFAGVRDGAFSYAGAQVRDLGNAVPLAQGIYLDSLALALCVEPRPLKLKGAAGIRFGPELGDRKAALLEGELEYVDDRPWVITARGSLALFDRRFSSGHLIYRASGAVDFGFDAKLDLTVASLDAAVAGWIETREPARFAVDGTGRVCVGGVACADGEVTASDVGVAGCFTLGEFTYQVLVKDPDWRWYATWRVHWEPRSTRVRGGLGYRWTPARLDLLGSSCDIGPYRAVRAARVAVAAGRGEREIRLPDEPAVALRVEGAGAPPKLVMTGPDGRRIASARGAGAIDQGSHVIAEDPATNVTHVLIASPRAGDWTIAPQSGSVVASVQLAETREQPTVVAAVGGRGARRVLGYAYESGGQAITFVERGAGDSEAKVIGAAAGRPCRGAADGPSDRGRPLCGRLRFTPADGAGGGRRAVYAVVSEDGVAFDEQLVARYDVEATAAPQRPRRLRLARRRGRRLVVSWASPPGTRGHDLRATLGDGRRILITPGAGARRAVIGNVGRRVRVRVRLVALDGDLRPSRPARARLGAGRRGSRRR